MLSTNDHVPHEYNLVEVRRERLLGKSERSINAGTVEVTISIALDSYRAPGHEHQADVASYNWSVLQLRNFPCLGEL